MNSSLFLLFERLLKATYISLIWVTFLLYPQDPFSLQEHTPSKLAEKPVSDVDLNQFIDYGFIFLKKSDLNFADKNNDVDGDKTAPPTFNYKEIIFEQIVNTNKFLIKKMVKMINTNEEPEDKNLLLYRDSLLEILDPNYFSANTQTNQTNQTSTHIRSFKGIDTINLFTEKKFTGIILNDADVVELYEVEVDGEVQKMVSLKGGVNINFNDNSLQAQEVDINVSTKNIYGRESVVLRVGNDEVEGNNVLLDLNEQVGYLFNATGIREGSYFEGKLFKVNERNHFTVEEGWITFSTNSNPYYRLEVSRFDSYGKDKSIYQNVMVYVHNQPFFWVPYFMRYPVSTGLNLSFGENRRVGYYMLTRTSFDLPYVSKLLLKFNIYEKLGLYFSIQNINKILNSNYNLLIALAYYTENLNIRTKPEKLTYTYHTGMYLNSVSSVRHKIEYSHNFNFADSSQNLVKSSLQFKLKNVSDPFITDNFPMNLKHFDIRKLIERHDRDESLYTASPSDRNHYKIDYNLSAPAVSLAISLGWNYDIFKDLNKLDQSVDELYTMYLKNMTLPMINFNLGSTLDPYRNDGDRWFYLNVGYRASLSYSGSYAYKDGVPAGEGNDLMKSVDAYSLIKENFSFKIDGSLSRGFTIDQDKNSLWDLGYDWFSWSLNNSMSVSYNKNWVGKNYSSSDDTKDDKSVFAISYNFSSSMNFNTSVPTWFDFVLNNSWSISEGKTSYRYRAEHIRKFNLSATESTKNLNTSYGFSMKFNFPSSTLKGIWSSAYDYRSMLPVFTFSLINFSLQKNTSQEKILMGEKYDLDVYKSRGFSSSLSMQHKGYGLFYVPEFNYVFNSSVSLSYDLMPVKDKDGVYSEVNFFTDKSFWEISRFKNFTGNVGLNFSYKIWNWYNSLNYEFYRSEKEEIDPILDQFSTRTTISYKQTAGKWVNLDNIGFEYKWVYNFKDKRYKSDSMSLSINTTIDVLSYFKISMRFSTVNNHAYRYFQKKSDYTGVEKINFFQDIFASFGFLGREKQQNGLFKMGAFSIGISHDLDDWYASFSYSLAPVNYSKESLRGYYFDHKITFVINLRPENDPRGPAESRSNPFFEPLDKDFTPEAFED